MAADPIVAIAPQVAWYHRKWFVVLSLILFCPVGLVLLWTSPETRLSGRIVWSILSVLAIYSWITLYIAIHQIATGMSEVVGVAKAVVQDLHENGAASGRPVEAPAVLAAQAAPKAATASRAIGSAAATPTQAAPTVASASLSPSGWTATA